MFFRCSKVKVKDLLLQPQINTKSNMLEGNSSLLDEVKACHPVSDW